MPQYIGNRSKKLTGSYASAAALGEDIRRYLGGEPIDARRSSAAYVGWTMLKSRVARHPVLSTLVAIALTSATAYVVATPLFFQRWTWPSQALERLAVEAIPPPATAAGMESVRIIEIRDGEDYDALAQREGVEGVSTARWTSMRRMHGRLLEKLARAGARAVALDIVFRHPSEFDADLVRGMDAVREAGGAVVIVVPSWRSDEAGLPVQSETEPGLSLEIGRAAGVRWGSATFGLVRGAAVAPALALQRPPAPPMASFATEAYAAWRQPGAEPEYRIDPQSNTLHIVYVQRHAAVARAWRTVGEEDVIPVPSLTNRPVPSPDTGIGPGDLVGYLAMLIPEQAAFGAYTRGYEAVFSATEEDLRAWCDGKLVLVGDVRAGMDEHVIPGGRAAFGVHLQAATLGAIFARGGFWHPNRSVTLTTLGAGAGVVIVALTRGRWVWRLVLLMGLTLGAVGVAVLLTRQAHVVVNPLIPLVAIALGALAGALLNLMRTPSALR